MNQKRTMLEIIAPSVEEAIANGLAELGVGREAVQIETLDEGSRGLFGLGTRQARIRLTLKEAYSEVEEPPAPIAVEAETEAPSSAVQPEAPVPAPKPVKTRYEEVQQELTLDICRETVAELLDRMDFKCEVSAQYGEPDEVSGVLPVNVDINGDDLSILIGKRSETLNALQYIARQIVSKELGHNVTLIIDVEGYRQRRERQLRQLARRMAEQAIKTGKKQVLEPMSPGERRIIHMELRDNDYVTTQSFGEEPHRKVTILPKD
jgi:spoIIIJ-associated protein